MLEDTTPAFAIRLAEPADATKIATIHVRSWQHAYDRILPSEFLDALSIDDRESRWREHLQEPPESDRRTWVAVIGDRLVGFVGAGSVGDTDVPSDAAEVFAIYLEPSFFGSGVGRILLAHAVDDLKQRGFTEAFLWVLRDNTRARRFYETAGWRFDGSEKRELRGEVVLDEVRYKVSLSHLERSPR